MKQKVKLYALLCADVHPFVVSVGPDPDKLRKEFEARCKAENSEEDYDFEDDVGQFLEIEGPFNVEIDVPEEP